MQFNDRQLTKFWAQVRTGSVDECWIWQGAISSVGYGRFFGVGPDFKSGQVYAHRAAYSLVRGPIPEAMTIDHLCFVKRCVNPWHMEVVSLAVNASLGQVRNMGNRVKTHCPYGHAYDSENTRYRKDRFARECRRCDKRKAELAKNVAIPLLHFV